MSRRCRSAINLLLAAAIAAPLVWMTTGCTPTGSHSSTHHASYSKSGESPAKAVDDAATASPVDELWVIARPDGLAPHPAGDAAPAAQEDDATPGTGALMTTMPGEEKRIAVPLKHTRVDASISAYIATVDVQQQFHNPFDAKIEAVYVFPLPQNSAVNEFVMTIGDRKIRGIIREREEAEQIYNEAKHQGYVASLLTQQRPNVFTQKVANIEPGKAIDINIRYYNTLRYEDGWYEFVFPMVIGPRYNPPGSTDGIGAVGRGGHGLSGQTTEVQYLKPTERSGHDIALTLDIDAGVSIEAIESVNHRITRRALDETRMRVAIAEDDTLPNKDFVLRYRVAGETIKTNVLTHRDERGGYFTLVLYPPKDLDRVARSPMEMVFVIDCSGSMNGKPIAQAKDAVVHALKQLQPGDTFQVIRFSNDASQFGPRPVPATRRNVRDAVSYVKRLDGHGGTQMIEGVKAALDFPHTPDRFRFVSFMTDGYIGNDRQIIGEVRHRVRDSRVFSFGVGSSPNRYLMNRMAKAGRGAAAYLALNDDGGAVMDAFFQRISHPALTDIELDFGDANVRDLYPRQIPDLFVGRPVVLTGRFEGELDRAIRITGRAGGRTINIVLPPDQRGEREPHPALASVWARAKIADLYDQLQWDPDEALVEAIKQTALRYQLMSEFTAFVAVDSLTRTAGEFGTTVGVPVPVPEGVKYETTVQEN